MSDNGFRIYVDELAIYEPICLGLVRTPKGIKPLLFRMHGSVPCAFIPNDDWIGIHRENTGLKSMAWSNAAGLIKQRNPQADFCLCPQGDYLLHGDTIIGFANPPSVSSYRVISTLVSVGYNPYHFIGKNYPITEKSSLDRAILQPDRGSLPPRAVDVYAWVTPPNAPENTTNPYSRGGPSIK